MKTNLTNVQASANTLIEQLKTDASITDPAEAAIVAQLVNDTLMLNSRALAGEDVTNEMKFVIASSLNLADRKRQIVVFGILNFVQNIVSRVVTGALLGA